MILGDQKPLLGKLPMWTPNPAGIPQPVGAWIMNEGSGNDTFDLIRGKLNPFGNHDVPVPTWIPEGIRCTALDDTDTSYIDVFATELAIGYQDLSDHITITAKIKTSDTTNSISNWRASNTITELRQQQGAGCHIPFSFAVNNSLLFLGCSDNYTTTDEYEIGTVNVADGLWHIVSVVIEGDTFYFYVDGVLDVARTLAVATGDRSVGSTNSNMQISAASRDGGQKDAMGFNGDFGFVYIHGESFTPTQVAHLHQHPYHAWEYPDIKIYGVAAPAVADIVANSINDPGLGLMEFSAGRLN